MHSSIDKILNGDAPPTEEIVSCPLCDSAESEFLFWSFDRLHHLPGKFGVVRCRNCDLVRLSPRPLKESLGFYYPEDDYYSYQVSSPTAENADHAENLSGRIKYGIRQSVFNSLGYDTNKLKIWQKALQPLLVKLFKKKATYGWNERFPRFVKSGKALEIGCGSGNFLNILKQLGWDVKGVEISETAALTAKTAYGIDVFCGDIQDIPFEKESFDYIHMSHVVEHFSDPVKDLENIAQYLKKDGTIYIEVPNIDSFGQNKSGKYWLHWDAPRHLFSFTPETLTRTLEEAALSVIKMETLAVDFWAWESTYKLEEAAGKILDVRPQTDSKDKLRFSFYKKLSKLKHIINPRSGDYLYCWAGKRTN